MGGGDKVVSQGLDPAHRHFIQPMGLLEQTGIVGDGQAEGGGLSITEYPSTEHCWGCISNNGASNDCISQAMTAPPTAVESGSSPRGWSSLTTLAYGTKHS